MGLLANMRVWIWATVVGLHCVSHFPLNQRFISNQQSNKHLYRGHANTLRQKMHTSYIHTPSTMFNSILNKRSSRFKRGTHQFTADNLGPNIHRLFDAQKCSRSREARLVNTPALK